MTWNLFLDDERVPADITPRNYRTAVGIDPTPVVREWGIARSVEASLALIAERGMPSFISFDHDLGDGVPTGHDLAKLLTDLEMDGVLRFPEGFAYQVHSRNPVGAANIKGILDSYLQQRAPLLHSPGGGSYP